MGKDSVLANPQKPGETRLQIENVPKQLVKDCQKLCIDMECHWKDFVIKWLEYGLEADKKALDEKTKAAELGGG